MILLIWHVLSILDNCVKMVIPSLISNSFKVLLDNVTPLHCYTCVTVTSVSALLSQSKYMAKSMWWQDHDHLAPYTDIHNLL